jgi:spore coat protein U-like protein
MSRTAKLFAALASALAVLLIGDAPVSAATATGTVTVTASVAKNCTLSSPTLAFGAYDPTSGTPLDVSTTLTVTCTKSTTWAVGLGNGSNFVNPNRRMKDATSGDFLQYELYTDAAHTTVWNGTNTVTGAGTPATQPTIYGRIAISQFVTPAATYSDSVVATITF